MIIKSLIYILQSEHYSLSRFLKYAYSHSRWWGLQKRKKLVWTLKSILIFSISWFILLIIPFVYYNLFGLSQGLFVLILLELVLAPVIISLVVFLLTPLDYFMKEIKFLKAKRLLKRIPSLITVGIAGSYGKTSTKEILTAILKEKHEVIFTPDNINTDLGIADFVIKNFNQLKHSAVFVVEMGAYRRGDIARICRLVEPQYSITTGINEAHLEHFGSLENIVKAKFELAANTQKLAVFNFDDENIKNNYSKITYPKFQGISQKEATNIEFKEEFTGICFNSRGVLFESKLLALHNVTLILMCIKIAEELGLDSELIKRGVEKIEPIKHRLEPIYNSSTRIMVLDDSYNGNFNGIVGGIEVLQRAKGRKVVLTPGLVELGNKSKEIHFKIGKLYVQKVDMVLLIKSKGSQFIQKSLKENNFTNYKVYQTVYKAHEDLANILREGDTVLFQNDLTDNYL